MNRKVSLIARGFGKSYRDKQVLNDVNFTVHEGEIVGLLGKNGAGKTTLLKAITGIHGYEQGILQFDAKEIKQHKELTKDFGVLIESNFLNYLSGYENLKLLLWIDGEKDKSEVESRIDEILALVELKEAKHKKVKDYSYGMRQRLGLAQALLTARTFTVLDEPFLGLDPIGKSIVKEAIKEKAKQGMSILFSSHDLEDVAESCNHIILIKEGTVQYDGPMQKKTELIVTVDSVNEAAIQTLDPIEVNENTLIYTPESNSRIDGFFKMLVHSGMKIESIETRERSLVDMFA